MKKPNKRLFPVSQRDLAAYLGVSATMLNLSHTGRHGGRNLRSGASKKYAELMLAHQQTPKTAIPNTSLRKEHTGSGEESAKLSRKILIESKYAHAKSKVLKHKLEEMKAKEQEDLRWLKTVERLLSEINGNKIKSNDRGA